MKLSIIVPVFNEKKTIEEVIKRVISAPAFDFEKEIVVVDDCSSDGTSELLEKLKEKFKFLLLRHEKNLGKGAAIKNGLNYLTGDIVLIQDADLEYDPKDYQKVLKPILEGKTKVVYGSRNLSAENKPSSKIYNLGGKFLSFFFNLFFKTKLTDVMTCYKVFKKEVIFPSELSENRFGFDCEITAKIVKKGFQILEVPISYHARSFKEGKKIRLKDGLRSVYVILKCYFSPIFCRN
jgi:dolichol-phosphate mannosyltransferase